MYSDERSFVQGTGSISPTLGKYFLHSLALAALPSVGRASCAGCPGLRFLGAGKLLLSARLAGGGHNLARERGNGLAGHGLRRLRRIGAPGAVRLGPAEAAVAPGAVLERPPELAGPAVVQAVMPRLAGHVVDAAHAVGIADHGDLLLRLHRRLAHDLVGRRVDGGDVDVAVMMMVAEAAAVVLAGFGGRYQGCHCRSQSRGTDNDPRFVRFLHGGLHSTQGVCHARTVAEGDRRRCFT